MTSPAEKKAAASHDKLFKQLLRWFLPEFLRLFFPEKASHLNFDTLTFIDKELILPMFSQERRIGDIVAEVKTVTGEPEIILVHLEVEGRDKASLPERMFEYYAMLRLLLKRPVLPFTVVLLPNAGGLSYQTYREQLFGEDILTLSYGQVALRDLASGDYFDQDNPLAATLTTLMKTDPKQQAELKLASALAIVDSPLTEERKLFLMKVVDTYLPTTVMSYARKETMEALEAIELHWSDRARQEGIELGMEQGIELGIVRSIVRLLQRRFPAVPANLTARLEQLSSGPLEELLDEALTAADLVAFERRLAVLETETAGSEET